MQEIFSNVANEVAERWLISNTEFKEPIVCGTKAIALRVNRSWSAFSKIARHKSQKANKKCWEPKLDKLLDIAFCKCRIVYCSDNDAPCNESCDDGAHCFCKCDLNLRIPKKELIWIKTQREKQGSVSCMQEFGLDLKETAKLRLKCLRKSTEQARLTRQREEASKYKLESSVSIYPTDVRFDDESTGVTIEINNNSNDVIVSDSDKVSDSEEDSTIENQESYVKRNYLDISNAAVASIRFGVSSTATAAIINGLLKDIMKAGKLVEDKKNLICDSMKVFRAKECAMKYSRVEENFDCERNIITGIFVDGRKDKTLVLIHDKTTGTFRKQIIKENHITVTEEPRGRYLTHYTPKHKSEISKPAKQCAIGLFDWLMERGKDLNLQLIGSDTTNEMSGWKGGMLHFVEELLNRKLFRSFCWLHINELPFRHIMEKLDGPTSSDKGWSGAVGKLLSKVENLERITKFMPIPLLEPLVTISEDFLKQMSTDSLVAWKYLNAILKGKLDPEVAALKCGRLSHSRWLTCGMRCLLLYMSKHDLKPDNAEILRLLATWVTQVYFPMFFEIKVKHDIKYGSCHLLKLFQLWQKQDDRIKEASKLYLKSESWWAHPENILVSLLCFDNSEQRLFAVDIILAVRAGSELGSTDVRPFKVPQTINLDACDIKELIDWEKGVITEPIFTANMSLVQLNALIVSPLQLPLYSLHTQSCERAVKLVTEAAQSVCGWDKRDGFIRTQLRNRELMPLFKSRKDFK